MRPCEGQTLARFTYEKTNHQFTKLIHCFSTRLCCLIYLTNVACAATLPSFTEVKIPRSRAEMIKVTLAYGVLSRYLGI
jgi:hypothetical protein